jgi:hypothetical protein
MIYYLHDLIYFYLFLSISDKCFVNFFIDVAISYLIDSITALFSIFGPAVAANLTTAAENLR